MHYLDIYGGNKLSGEVTVSGAKNSSLPLIASTILSKTPVTITNMPRVADIKTMLKLMTNLGAEATFEGNTLQIDAEKLNGTVATYDIVKTMRASILVLGPLLARFGKCDVSLPGGCAIGQRPVDLHLKALEAMGAEIEIKNGYVEARAPRGLTGTTIVFDKITVTGTENIVMAAALAKGTTKIINAAKEPEVVQLCEVLRLAGANIAGIGTDELIIDGSGGELYSFKDIDVIPDRIEAGTYLCAAAITNSTVTLKKVNLSHMEAFISKLQEMGFSFDYGINELTIKPAKKIKPVDIVTTEFPGFPTDMQAQFMALATQAQGTSIIEERLFENRFMHVSELTRLGATIHLTHNTATIEGGAELTGADVMATDLRASSALVIAALVANGKTRIHRIYHLDRGYEELEKKLIALGAQIERGDE
ncbi:MAG: UDP-N-acetylglucosamine 1-carboxyvinyltransferase [Campylobacterales bacterium]